MPYSRSDDESTLMMKYLSAASVDLRLLFVQQIRNAFERLLNSSARKSVMNSPAEASSHQSDRAEQEDGVVLGFPATQTIGVEDRAEQHQRRRGRNISLKKVPNYRRAPAPPKIGAAARGRMTEARPPATITDERARGTAVVGGCGPPGISRSAGSPERRPDDQPDLAAPYHNHVSRVDHGSSSAARGTLSRATQPARTRYVSIRLDDRGHAVRDHVRAAGSDRRRPGTITATSVPTVDHLRPVGVGQAAFH